MQTKYQTLKAEFDKLCIEWQDCESYSIKSEKISKKLEDLSRQIAVEVEAGRC